VGVLNGKLYVAGGIDAAGSASRRLDVYTPDTNSWSTKAAMPTARHGTAGAVVGGRLHVIGGRRDGT
jgi:N-acetylneuraminic acid mutarotase